jgi:hypothetical protein
MKRFVMSCTAAAAAALGLMLIGGCEGKGEGPKMNNPFAGKSAAPAAAKTPAQADYFEMRQDGKTYVLGSNASREAFMNGQMPPLKETTFDNGKTVYVENSGFNDYNRLVAEYKKAKGL